MGTIFTGVMMYRTAYIPKGETRAQQEEREANADSIVQKTYGEILREVRGTLAIREKKILEMSDELSIEKRKRYEILKERDVYAAHDLQMQRLLRRHAPKVDIPPVEVNGNSTPPKRNNK